VGFGYPFPSLMAMTFTELTEWLEVAIERIKRQNNNGA
jgi:hypothetical protein